MIWTVSFYYWISLIWESDWKVSVCIFAVTDSILLISITNESWELLLSRYAWFITLLAILHIWNNCFKNMSFYMFSFNNQKWTLQWCVMNGWIWPPKIFLLIDIARIIRWFRTNTSIARKCLLSFTPSKLCSFNCHSCISFIYKE